MAITLPDFTALPQATPQATGGPPQYPAENPTLAGEAVLAKGIGTLGGAFTDIGAYQDIAQTKMNKASADADFSTRTIPITEALKVETDPAKITELRAKFQEALETSSQAFGDNSDARNFWLKSHAPVVATGQAEADLRNTVINRDNYVAGMIKKNSDLVREAAGSTDPQAVDIALHNIDQSTEAARVGGYMTATAAAEHNIKLKNDLIAGRIGGLAVRKQFDEADALLAQYHSMLGPVAANHLENIIRVGRERGDVAGAIKGYLNGGAGYVPPSSLGAGGGGPGSTTPAEHYSYLISQGASPNEAALLTSAAGAESKFNAAQTHDAAELAKRGLPPGYGLYGHNADRLAAMQREAGSQTPTWQQQVQFALKELRSRPEGAQVNAAKTPEELTDLQLQFEVPGVPRREERLASTREYMMNPPKAGAAAAGAGGMPGVIDKTADAGVGQKFGPLQSPQGMVIHHTAGGESVDDVISTFKKTNFPAQFIIDRQGKIYQTIPDGYQGQHVRDSWGPLGAGKGNANMEGVEIIANNDGDVLPVQQEAAARLVAMRAQKYGWNPQTSVFGHGELNPGHKEADEGMSTVTRIRNGSLPTQVAAAPGGAPAAPAAAPAPAATGTLVPGQAVLGNTPLDAVPGGTKAIQSAAPIAITSGAHKGKYLLLPGTAADGSALTEDQALDEYEKTGKHLGIFNNPGDAAAYANRTGTGAAPVAGAPAARPAGPQAFDAVGGDSIARSGAVNADLPGSHAESATKPVYTGSKERKPVEGREPGDAMAVGGRDPLGNLAYINTHPEEFANKRVFYSTGLMNAGKTAEEARKSLPLVEQALDKLKELGATVVVVGTDKGRYNSLNRELDVLASARQMPFGGALPTTDVHPGAAAMKEYARKAAQLLPASSGDTGPPPAPATAGTDTYVTPGAEGGDYGGGGAPAGQLEAGNIDLNARPVVKNPDGTISTVRSIGIEEDGKQVLIPTVAADGSRILSNDEAIKQYRDTGQHLGKFDTVDNANAAAEQLHQDQATQYAPAEPGGGSREVKSPELITPSATPAPATAGTTGGSITKMPPGGWTPHVDVTEIERAVDANAAAGRHSETEAAKIKAGLIAELHRRDALVKPQRDELANNITGGLALLKDGRAFDYNPDEIRHYYGKPEADKIIQALDDARDAGRITSQVAGAGQEQIDSMRADIQAGLDKGGAVGADKRKMLADHFEVVAKKREAALDKALVETETNRYFGAGPGLAAISQPDFGQQPARDPNDLVQRVQADIDYGRLRPEVGALIQRAVVERTNVLNAAEHNDKVALNDRINATTQALADGKDVEAIDPTVIRHYFTPEEADKRIQALADANESGGYYAQIKNAAPEDIAQQRYALEQRMNDPTATDYLRRREQLTKYNAALTKHVKELGDDPGGYLQTNSPLVAEKFNALLTDEARKTPQAHAQAFADFARTTLAEQARLGVPEAQRTVLSKGQAAATAAKLATLDPTKTDVIKELRNMAQGYGASTGTTDYWPKVFGEMVKEGKLPAGYQILASMDRPDQLVAAEDLSRALGYVAQKGGLAAIKEASSPDVKLKLDQALETELADFKASTYDQSQGANLYDKVKDSAQALALYYGYKGQSQNEAVKHAVDGILRNKYDFGEVGPTTIRVPKGTLRDVERAADIAKAGVTLDQLGPVPVRDPVLAAQMTGDQAKKIWMDAIRNGGWANNADDTGIQLMGKFRDGANRVIQRFDGTPVELRFSDVPAIVRSAPAVAPMGPEDIGLRLPIDIGDRSRVIGGPGAF